MNATPENSVTFADKARDVSGSPITPLAKSGFTTEVSLTTSQDSILSSHMFIDRGFTPPHYDPQVVKSLQEKADKFAASTPQFMTTKANYQAVGELQSRFEYQQAMISGMTKSIITLSQQTESISTKINTPEQFRDASQKLGSFSRAIGSIEKLLGGIIDSEESAYINDSKTGFARNNKAFCKLRGSIFNDIKQLLSECKKSIENADDFLKNPDFFARQVESLGEARAAIIDRRNSNGSRSQIVVEQAESAQVWNVTTAAPSEENLLELLYGDEINVRSEPSSSHLLSQKQRTDDIEQLIWGDENPTPITSENEQLQREHIKPAVLGLSQLGETRLGLNDEGLSHEENTSHELNQDEDRDSEISEDLNQEESDVLELGEEGQSSFDANSSLLSDLGELWGDEEATERFLGDDGAREASRPDQLEHDTDFSTSGGSDSSQEVATPNAEDDGARGLIKSEGSRNSDSGEPISEALLKSAAEEISANDDNNWISRGVRDQDSSATPQDAAPLDEIEDADFEIVERSASSTQASPSEQPEALKYVGMHEEGGLIDVLTKSGWYDTGKAKVAQIIHSEKNIRRELKDCVESLTGAEQDVANATNSIFKRNLAAAAEHLTEVKNTFGELVKSLRDTMQEQLNLVLQYSKSVRESFAGRLFNYDESNSQYFPEPILRAGVPVELFGTLENLYSKYDNIITLASDSKLVEWRSLKGDIGASRLLLTTVDGRELELWEVSPGRFRVFQTDEVRIPRYCGSFWAREGRIEEVVQAFIDGPEQIATLKYVDRYPHYGTYRILGPNETPYIQVEW